MTVSLCAWFGLPRARNKLALPAACSEQARFAAWESRAAVTFPLVQVMPFLPLFGACRAPRAAITFPLDSKLADETVRSRFRFSLVEHVCMFGWQKMLDLCMHWSPKCSCRVLVHLCTCAQVIHGS